MLFFPGIASPAAAQEIIPFSSFNELIRLSTYTVPAGALIWYLILEKKSLQVFPGDLKIGKTDAVSFAWGFAGLILTGVIISVLMNAVNPFETPPRVKAPGNLLGWTILVFSCAGTGYLEESFFRFYLLQKLEDWVPSRPVKIIFAVLLFALCHGYEGPWGILNAALAGILLSVLYEKFRTIHGISWAHALYNIFVYVIGIF